MKYQKILLPIVLVNLAALAALTLQLPEIVPTHVNFAGVIDNWGSRWTMPLLGLLPLLLLGGMLVYKKCTATNPSVQKNKKIEHIIFTVIVLFSTLITWVPLMLAWQLQQSETSTLSMELIVGLPLGVLMMILSNYMGVIKQNKYLGVRTKWTLLSEEVWQKTHRHVAYWGMLGGAIMVVSCLAAFLLKAQALALVGLVVAIVLLTIVPCLYSRWLYKKLEHNKTP